MTFVRIIALLSLIAATTSCSLFKTGGGNGTTGTTATKSEAVLDQRNTWSGGVIGEVTGTIKGATISEVSLNGARQAAKSDKPVLYTTREGKGTYYAEPSGPKNSTYCRKIREKIYENGYLISDRNREICLEGKK